jgi:hypothetical protein
MALAAALLASGARADVLHVPADFPTVQEAADVAQPGDEIVLAAGTYHDPVVVHDAQGVHIRGQGQVILAGGTLADAALHLLNCTGVTVEHVRVQDAPGFGIFVDDCVAVALRHVRVQAGNTGILATGTAAFLADHALVEGPTESGMLLSQCTSGHVMHCTVRDTSLVGIGVSDSLVCFVEHCRVLDAATQAIALGFPDPSDDCQVRDCLVLDALDQGLVSTGTDCVLLDNRVQGAGAQGLLVLGGAGGVVQGNKLIGCNVGIETHGTNLMLRDNRIVKPAADGLVCAEASSQVLDTRVLHAGHDGFVTGALADGGSIMGCKALHAAEHGFEVDGTHSTLTGNLASGAGQAGFHVLGTENLFVGNVAKGSGTIGLDDDVGGNSYLDNDFGVLN